MPVDTIAGSQGRLLLGPELTDQHTTASTTIPIQRVRARLLSLEDPGAQQISHPLVLDLFWLLLPH